MQHPKPNAITENSFEIIEGRLGPLDVTEAERSLIIRIAHTTGDVEFGTTFTFSDGAVDAAVEALRGGCDVITDVETVRTGIREKPIEAFGGGVHCFLNETDVIRRAKREETTRSAVAMRFAGERLNGAIVAIGNAPTALLELIEMIEEGIARPAVVIGVPVGFVRALESKEILHRTDVPHITVLSERGGSTIAATIVNGIGVLAAEAGAPSYRTALGKVSGKQRGITTGTCAAAAAKAATLSLLSGSVPESVEIRLPSSKRPYSNRVLEVPVLRAGIEGDAGYAAVQKDAGDDNDVTHEAEIVAHVRRREEVGVAIEGGKGVGRVTRDGLPVPPGRPAINPVPLRMIRLAVQDAAESLLEKGEESAAAPHGFEVEISVPKGEEIAEQTWNPRLGIEGGISIIGTAGVVEPRDSDAFRRSIEALVKGYAASGRTHFIVTPGYVGERYLFERIGVTEESVVTCGDHVGATLDSCLKAGAESVSFVGHLSKLAKVAAGVFDTHSKYADARLETLAALVAAAGAPVELTREILDLKLAEEAVVMIREAGFEEAFSLLAQRVCARMRLRMKERVEVGCVVLSLDAEPLATWPNAEGDIDWNRFG